MGKVKSTYYSDGNEVVRTQNKSKNPVLTPFRIKVRAAIKKYTYINVNKTRT